MSNYVVTIARQYGSGGREVGRLLSERTGLKFYDKDLITMAAQKSGMSSEALQKAAIAKENETEVFYRELSPMPSRYEYKLAVAKEIAKELLERI